MSSVINTNVLSLNSQRQLGKTQAMSNQAMERLSSGLRINGAKDDAAGLAISTGMQSQIKGINQGVRNANDGISMAQTAEGSMDEMTNILQRMRELSVQASNDSNSASNRESIQTEVDQLYSEIDRISETTQFNGTNLLNGSTDSITLQVGANSGETIDFSIAPVTADSLELTGVSMASSQSAQDSIDSIDGALGKIMDSRSNLGALQNRLGSTISNLQNISQNTSSANSRIQDADYAAETSKMSKAQILQQAGSSMLAQANASPQSVLSLLG